MLPQLVQNPSNGLYMFFILALNIDEDVIEIYYHKKVELLCQDLVDITLKHSRCVGQSKKHDLIFKVAILGPENHRLFVSFPNSYSMIGIDQIELSKSLSPI